jgi:DNA-binding response OmpR family regulator
MRQRITIVDDDSERLVSLRHVLETDEYEVKIFSDFYAIIESVSENTPDLFIVNMLMSRVNGFKAIKLIRTQSNVPIIVLGATNDGPCVERAFTCGADDYLPQPFRSQILRARVAAKFRKIRVPVS